MSLALSRIGGAAVVLGDNTHRFSRNTLSYSTFQAGPKDIPGESTVRRSTDSASSRHTSEIKLIRRRADLAPNRYARGFEKRSSTRT